jgi:hypothetical protein
MDGWAASPSVLLQHTGAGQAVQYEGLCEYATREIAMVARGGALVCTDSQRPIMPSTATRVMLPMCQGRSRPAQNRTVTAGTIKSAVGNNAPTGGGGTRRQNRFDRKRKGDA